MALLVHYLGLTKPYVAMIEKGKEVTTDGYIKRFIDVFELNKEKVWAM